MTSEFTETQSNLKLTHLQSKRAKRLRKKERQERTALKTNDAGLNNQQNASSVETMFVRKDDVINDGPKTNSATAPSNSELCNLPEGKKRRPKKKRDSCNSKDEDKVPSADSSFANSKLPSCRETVSYECVEPRPASKSNDICVTNKHDASSIETMSVVKEDVINNGRKANSVTAPSNSESSNLLEGRQRRKPKKQCNSCNSNDEDKVPPADNNLTNGILAAEKCQVTPFRECVEPNPAEPYPNQSLPLETYTQLDLRLAHSRKNKKRKKKMQEKQGNALKDNDIDDSMNDVKLAVEGSPNYISKTVALKLTKVEEKFATTEGRNGSPTLPSNILVRQWETDAKADANLSETQNPKADKKKKRSGKERKVSISSGNSLEAVKQDEVIQTSLIHSNQEGFGSNDGRSDSETADTDLTSKKEQQDKAVAILSEKQSLAKTKKRRSGKRRKVSGSLGNSLEADKEESVIQTSLNHSNQEVSGNNNAKSGSETTDTDLASQKENSLISEKSGVLNLLNSDLVTPQDENTKVAHNSVQLQSVNNLARRKRRREKKRKSSMNCSDHVHANNESEKKMELQTLEASVGEISSMKGVTLHAKVQGREPRPKRHQPRAVCHCHSKKKLLILDLNGILVDVVLRPPFECHPDAKVSGKSVFKRPFCDDFLEFCFKTFDVGIWSSRHRNNMQKIILNLMRDFEKRFCFIWDQSHCTRTKFKTVESANKPIFLKELERLWSDPNIGQCESCGKLKYDESNSLLVDDSPYKVLRNPPYTAIFPYPYQHRDVEDSALGPSGDLRLYLQSFATAENAQKFVQENPFGQRAITESDPSWKFYSKVKGSWN